MIRSVLAVVGVLAIVAVAASAVYLFGGFYQVAASDPSPDLVDAMLFRVRDAAISRRLGGPPPISLDDPQIIEAGARAFVQHGCWECHSAPGLPRKPFGRAMNPAPPGARTFAREDPREMFWIIRNGIRMTATPSFGKLGVSDNDIWQIV